MLNFHLTLLTADFIRRSKIHLTFSQSLAVNSRSAVYKTPVAVISNYLFCLHAS